MERTAERDDGSVSVALTLATAVAAGMIYLLFLMSVA